jgi:peptidyl-prolyl cis-trans isomerase D
MLKPMRENAKYFYVLFFIVILSFIFWGVGSMDKLSGGKENLVAQIGQYKITGQDYWRSYENARRIYEDIYKDKFTDEMQKQLKDRVLNTMVENKVLLTAAHDAGITVSDEELNEAIRHETAFMNNGSFDPTVYQNRLRLSRLTPEVYEAMRRQDLTVEKMRRMIELTAKVPEEELGKLSGDEQNVKQIREAVMNDAKNRAVQSYVEGFEKGMKIQINRDLIS